MIETLFSGELFVHYGQFYVESRIDEGYPKLDEAFAGQSNGLCGAVEPGFLWFITGLHTGRVGLTAELHQQPPPAGEEWQEIVEVSFTPQWSPPWLVEWGGERWLLDLKETSYRVRYCGTGLDEAREADPPLDTDPPVDHYLVQFWPSPEQPDQVLKQTSECAAYWHRSARQLPPSPTPAEKAEAEQQALRR